MSVIAMNRHGRLGARSLVWIALLVAITGCHRGGSSSAAGSQATVSGSVMNDGKPIGVKSSVVFYCADLATTASGTVDTHGKFSLKPADPKVGIPAGRYQVMVRPPEGAPVSVGSDEYKKMMMPGAATQTPPKTSDIPENFQSFAASKIELEVRPGANTFDLDLAKLAQ